MSYQSKETGFDNNVDLLEYDEDKYHRGLNQKINYILFECVH